jgi:lipoate-protein ligase B
MSSPATPRSPGSGETPERGLRLLRPGRLDYAEGLALQERLVREVQEGGPEALVLCEHPPVVTLGRGADLGNLRGDAAFYASCGIELHQTGRGGDVTYHGPGQVVGYPVIELGPERRDLHRYLRDLEEVLLRTLAELGVVGAVRHPGLTGVWAGGAKVAAIGVRVARWVTSHGFALNLDPDLEAFELIVPCGIADRPVTSVARLLGRAPERAAVEALLARWFGEVFGRTMEETAAPFRRSS